MSTLRATWRGACGSWQVLLGLLTCALLFPFLPPAQRMRHVGRWSARMLSALGIGLEHDGALRPAAALVVANHISWLDILAINAVHPVRFVSKADVRHWPLLGWMVASGGTLFIERERKRDALRVVHQVAEALAAGEIVAVFPEGTTSEGNTLLPFHANLLQAAIATGTPVQPVALRYSDRTNAVSASVCYVGETTLAQSVMSVLWADGLRVRVQVLPPMGTRQLERRALAEFVREQIVAALDQALP